MGNQPVTWTDLKQELEVHGQGESSESEYRRGYADGRISAVERSYALMFESGLNCQAACDACWDHWHGPLIDWKGGDCTQLVTAPRLLLRKSDTGPTESISEFAAPFVGRDVKIRRTVSRHHAGLPVTTRGNPISGESKNTFGEVVRANGASWERQKNRQVSPFFEVR